MKMQRLNIQLMQSLKSQIDSLRLRGTSAAGLIRHLLERHFNSTGVRQKGR
ncbi:MAG: hypothetical protein H8K07_14790 [Nitrospira sp.]|nr:hypothetical protein [Nitrospira sp.]